ncbi:MAG TPA: hypothetical protein DGT23_19470 [Micromonosporaceae bacterium]|nr:hypothetical protein [Micromonosporaceae bacterium]
MVTLISPIHRTTTPYPRYLMAMKLGRLLRDDEHVDHVDNDPSNNAMENLQILTPLENQRKGKTKPLVSLVCASCGIAFERQRHKVRGLGFRAEVKVPTCCSRSCSARYQMLARSKSP